MNTDKTEKGEQASRGNSGKGDTEQMTVLKSQFPEKDNSKIGKH